MAEHKVIWLSPQCPRQSADCDHPDEFVADGRLWSEDCQWDDCPACGAKPVRYVLSNTSTPEDEEKQFRIEGANRMNATEIIKAVREAIEYPEDRSMTENARLAILATLDAIREPTRAMLNESSQDAASCGIETCAKVNWCDMIDTLKREIAG